MEFKDRFIEELCLVFCNHEAFYRKEVLPLLQECNDINKTEDDPMAFAKRVFFRMIPQMLLEYMTLYGYSQKVSLGDRIRLAGLIAENLMGDCHMKENGGGNRNAS